ncbi:MAG: hypothetical protein ACHP7N_16425 [Caulobacterales bacterium]
MRRWAVALLSGTAALGASAPALSAPNVLIRDAVAQVVVLPENRTDVSVEVYRPNPRLPLRISQFGDTVIIDGRLIPFFLSCHGEGAGLRAFVFGRGDIPVAEFPQVLIHTPMSAAVNAGGVVRGSVARSHDLTLDHAGCGDWTVGNVEGRLEAHVSGVGFIRAGSAGSAELAISGLGRVTTGPVTGDLAAHISGSGSIITQSAGSAELDITGSGNVKTGPLSAGVQAHISGAGGLDVASVNGPIEAHVSGVGNVNVGGGHATVLQAHVSGSGNVIFGGVADSVDAEVSGSGDVDVAKVTGQVNQHISGVGAVHIGGH